MMIKQIASTSLLALCLAFVPATSWAQYSDIQTGTLGSAQNYEVGLLDGSNGGLDSALWQGTSAATAARLLAGLPGKPDSALATEMVKAVVLSTGVPPEASSNEDFSAYRSAKMAALFSVGGDAALSRFVANDPQSSQEPQIRADITLAEGNISGACQIADSIKQGRAEPYWAKLRSVCHLERGELPAAELTIGLLRDSGHKDPQFFDMFKMLTGTKKPTGASGVSGSPLISFLQSKLPNADGISSALLSDGTAAPKDRLAALFQFADQVDSNVIVSIFSELSIDTEDLAGSSSYDFETAAADPGPRGTARLFQLARVHGDQVGSAKAMAAFFVRADKAGAFIPMARALETEIAILPSSQKAANGWPYFARLAIDKGDIATLQGLYQSLPPDAPERSRLALASDAIGNGFMLGPLGQDIENRLAAEGPIPRRARRDAFIALALGSKLTGDSARLFEPANAGSGHAVRPGELWALEDAAKAGSRAETLLRTVSILEQGKLDDVSFATVVRALQTAGLTQFSGRLAATDFFTH